MEKLKIHQGSDGARGSFKEIDDFLRDFLKKLQLNLYHECDELEGVIQINIGGSDRALLLSNSASLLNGVEYLLNKIFPGSRDEAPRISVDSENYWKHRELELKLLAEMASKKVILGKKALSLQPMIPKERRIIHLALAGIEGIRSQSDGEGDNRSITIYPTE
jgi:spoIIIJ-associated protein